MTRKGPISRTIVPTEARPCNVPVELRCASCGKAALYELDRIFIDPDLLNEGAGELDEAFGFTAYIHCERCGAPGPWELTFASRRLLGVLLDEADGSPEHARIHRARLTLFDKTTMRWATQGETHLKQLIEKDPGDYYLWNRLGNLYAHSCAPALGLEAFHEPSNETSTTSSRSTPWR
jgi:hypothetical protein